MEEIFKALLINQAVSATLVQPSIVVVRDRALEYIRELPISQEQKERLVALVADVGCVAAQTMGLLLMDCTPLTREETEQMVSEADEASMPRCGWGILGNPSLN